MKANEREVGKIIYSKNYRLIPQYEPFGPGSYRIDFVVEGLKSRLAVECDGSHHDDPEQIERDMVRQRQLERCKWVFWRVSASSFYFDRDKAMASLWQKLEELGIQPLTQTAPIEAPVSSEPQPPPQSTAPAFARVVPKPTGLSRQQDLIPSDQMELPSAGNTAPAAQNRDAEVVHGVSPALRDFIEAARQKRPHGVLIFEEIGHVVLELMPQQGRVSRSEIIKKTADALDFSEAAYERIDESIRRLEELRKVCADSESVWRRDDYLNL